MSKSDTRVTAAPVPGRGTRRRLLAATLLLAAVTACAPPGEDEAAESWQAAAATDSLGVGDRLRLEIGGRWPGTWEPTHLAWGADPDSVFIVARDSTAIPTAAGLTGRRYRLDLIAPRPGPLQLPPAALVGAHGETLALSDPLRVQVTTHLPDSAALVLQPLAPLAALPRFPWVAVIAAVVIVLVAGVVLLLWLRARRRRQGAVPEIPAAPADVEFRESLRRLLARGLAERGEVRGFVQELSWVLRRYLGRRWERPALEATRPEIVRWLPATRLCVRDQGELASWLEATDRIKFAGETPLSGQTEELVARAEAIVARTETLLEPAPTEEQP
ncbi:MAG: hypothetical protein KAY32_02775 [Candidatus Eisenbacteria sp.]|nr:hypothetical protein [Candidatus Eisenbacteria bacterium]